MKWLIGVIGSLMLVLESGCSLAPTTYQVPDYYETKTVPYHYKVGEVRNIDELRPSKNPQANGWINHRSYRKQYFFE